MNAAEITHILRTDATAGEKEMLARFSTIESLVSRDEALALNRLCMTVPRSTRVLEIGPYRGGSTVAIGHAAQAKDLQVYCIDMWADYRQQPAFSNMDQSTLDDHQILTQFMNNTAFISDRLFMLRGDAAGFGTILGENSFSLIFVDGAHDYVSVIDDIVLSLKVIGKGGIICGHDYHSAGTDVIRAVHDLIMKSEAITVKGLIENTSIWFARIDDPGYDYLIATTVRHMTKGDYRAAYENLIAGIDSVRQTHELEMIRTGLEAQLGLVGSGSTSTGTGR